MHARQTTTMTTTMSSAMPPTMPPMMAVRSTPTGDDALFFDDIILGDIVVAHEPPLTILFFGAAHTVSNTTPTSKQPSSSHQPQSAEATHASHVKISEHARQPTTKSATIAVMIILFKLLISQTRFSSPLDYTSQHNVASLVTRRRRRSEVNVAALVPRRRRRSEINVAALVTHRRRSFRLCVPRTIDQCFFKTRNKNHQSERKKDRRKTNLAVVRLQQRFDVESRRRRRQCR